jgi:exodeoxyribonuclease VII small subunit
LTVWIRVGKVSQPNSSDRIMASKKDSPPEFEAALDELEKLVALMEEGDLPLEETLKQFEKGIKLTRQCQKSLAEAEQKVEILVEKSGRLEPEPFEPGQ